MFALKSRSYSASDVRLVSDTKKFKVHPIHCLAACLLSYLLAVVGLAWVRASGLEFALGYEGNMFWQTHELAQGANIYPAHALLHQPWSVNIYPPLYMCIGALLFKAFGESILLLRLISLGGLLLSFSALVLTLRHLGCSWAAITATVIALLSSSLEPWTPSIRADQFALGLSMLALYLFVANWSDSLPQSLVRKLGLSASVFVCVLACMAKQQSVVLPLSICIFVCLRRRFCAAAVFGAAVALSLLAVTMGVQALTGGYIQHTTFLAGSGWSCDQLITNLVGLRREVPRLLFSAVVIVTALLRPGGRKPEGTQLLPFVLSLVSGFLLLYSMGIPAAATNHALTFIFAVAMSTAVCIKDSRSAIVVLLLISCLWLPRNRTFPFVEPYAARTVAVLEGLNLRGKPVLSEDPILNYYSDSTCEIVDPTTFFINWVKNNRLGELERAIVSKRYAAIIMNKDDADCIGRDVSLKWPVAILKDVAANYKATNTVTGNGYLQVVFLPR